ncbi:MAG: aldo/keto reductase [Caulobacteraceae bacterium]|nr:MAG: aldo/keto reductase [Caulobacteraceae bacterium]
MQTRQLGRTGPTVSALGLGAMGMSDMYGPSDRSESLATVHAALDAGVTLIDTGDFYGSGHNEMLLAEALKDVSRDRYELSVKFGALRGPDGQFVGYDSRPDAMKNYLTMSLRRLQVDYLDVYRPSRLDPNVPIEDTIGAIGEMVKAGYVRHIGLSEVGVDTIRKAAATHAISDLQIEYSVISRGIEAAILPACRELGIGVTAYGVLARGLISGHWSKDRTAAGRDLRAFSPRFVGENLDHNLGIAETLGRLADDKGVTTAQLAIAWVAAQGQDIIPLVGARKRERLTEALGSLGVTLTADDLAAIEAAIPKGAAQGDRYPTALMAHLDSEK